MPWGRLVAKDLRWTIVHMAPFVEMEHLCTQHTQIESCIWQLKYIILHGCTAGGLVVQVLIKNQGITFSCC